jgi:toxin CcdB
MARYQVFRNKDAEGYLLDVQNDLLDDLNVRVLVPLMVPEDAPKPAHRLNPAFEIEGRRILMVTQYLSAVPVKELGPVVGNLRVHDNEITEALDMLFQGF